MNLYRFMILCLGDLKANSSLTPMHLPPGLVHSLSPPTWPEWQARWKLRRDKRYLGGAGLEVSIPSPGLPGLGVQEGPGLGK